MNTLLIRYVQYENKILTNLDTHVLTCQDNNGGCGGNQTKVFFMYSPAVFFSDSKFHEYMHGHQTHQS